MKAVRAASQRLWISFCCLVFGCPLVGSTQLLLSPDASNVERIAAEELKADIEQVCTQETVAVETYSKVGDVDFSGNIIKLGTVQSLPNESGGDSLEPETFLFRSTGNRELLILGADDRGLLYGVYEFSERVLGVDPLEYWTGKTPIPKTRLALPELDHRESPPEFKLRGYFDNDNDMLANWKGRKLIVEFDTWKEMIDSLARLRYNYIDIHDLLGRPEYYLREYYQEMTDYQTDLELVDKVIDYAHSKGLLVQIPMYLGWEFMRLDMDEVCITSHFDRWMEIYSYYLRETPLGKGDLFLARPRHPIYDWPYTCPEEEAFGLHPGPLLEAVFSGLEKLINRYRPGGLLVCDLWQEGRDMWQSQKFNLRRDVQMLWADDGFAQFSEWPTSQRAYDFGIYVHAGVWKNQVVQDPYPDRLKTAARNAVSRGMTHNMLVNGQSFKPFILNLEAAARVAWDPEGFDAEQYYTEWTTRYFGEAASPMVIQSLELLHDVHHYAVGYREVTKSSERILKRLYQNRGESEDIISVRTALALARQSLELAEEAGKAIAPASQDVYDDQILFPCRIFLENLELLKSLIEFNNAYVDRQESRDPKVRKGIRDLGMMARDQLEVLRTSLERGSRWQKWSGWYKPEHFRIHTPPPTLQQIDQILERL